MILHRPLKVLELFAGIGGAARAFEGLADPVAAIDINQNAQRVYRENFPHPYEIASLESIPAAQFKDWDADVWWASPPCQPFTVRGNRQGSADNRCRPLRYLIELLKACPPRYFFLENVPGFECSTIHDQLVETLKETGFDVGELFLCPTRFGIPNRRLRYYLVATLDPPARKNLESVARLVDYSSPPRPLKEFLDQENIENTGQSHPVTIHSADQLVVPRAILEKHGSGMNRVRKADRTSHCFTAAYGKSWTRSGSYLEASRSRGPEMVRRFSPTEVCRLLGFQLPTFSRTFALPRDLTYRQLWKLLGNSISVAVARELIVRALIGKVEKSQSV